MLLTKESVNNILIHNGIGYYINFDIDKGEGIFTRIQVKSFDPEKHIKLYSYFENEITRYKENGNKIIVSSGVNITNNQHFEGQLNLSNCIFKESVTVERKSLAANFNNSVFNKDVIFHDTEVHNSSFNNTKFYGDLKFTNRIIRNTSFILADFFEDVIFDNECQSVIFGSSTFVKKVEFKSIRSSSFINVFFEKQLFIKRDIIDLNFYNSTFYYPLKFHDISINGKIDFSKASFLKPLQFLGIKINNNHNVYVNFENSKFTHSLDLSRANLFLPNVKFRFSGINITPIPENQTLYANDIDINNKDSVTKSPIAMLRLRETYRLIKQYLKNENNLIDALTFHQHEMLAYQKELKFKNSKKDIRNRIVLWFNLISNKFGSDWVQGIKFTLIITVIFYLLFLLSISNKLTSDFSSDGFGKAFIHLLEFLNITKWDYKPFGIENYTWAYGVLFLGRIFIGYGYYQTIQAFRKYKSN